MEIEMEVAGVAMYDDDAVLLLRARTGGGFLLIEVTSAEAQLIQLRLENVRTRRPLTHTLMLKIIEDLGAKLAKVVMNELKDGFVHAQLCLNAKQRPMMIDARPSDAITLAIEANAPICADESLFVALAAAREKASHAEMKEWFTSLNPKELDKM